MRRRFSIKILWISLVGVGVFTMGIVTFQPFRPRTVNKIYIRADGSFDPPTTPPVPIETVDKIMYTFTDNINKSIVVERSHIVIDGGGFTMYGNRFADGIALQNAVNVTIKNIIIKAFSTAIILDDSDYNTVSGNEIANNGLGVRLDYSSNNTFSGNTITAHYSFGFELDYSSNNTFSNNTITHNGWGFNLRYSSENTVSDSNITANGYGFDLSHSSNNSFLNNTITANRRHHFNLFKSYHNIVSGNNITNGDSGGVFLHASYYNSFYGNNISANRGTALHLDYSSSNIVSSNSIASNNHSGVTLSYSHHNTVTGNIMVANNEFGVHLEASSNNTVTENTITNNGEKGARFTYYSENNTVTGNTIRNNPEGIKLSHSQNNWLFLNRFINNTIQANIVGPDTSIWDDGYPSGGNYWSDYEERYPNATEIGDSGLWDTPYVINEENVDNYPIIPEFPSLILLPLFVIATVLAAIIYKKKFSLVG